MLVTMFTLEDVVRGTGGRLDSPLSQQEPLSLRGVAIDSRGDLRGALFVALAGEHVDGRNFVEDAARHGAGGALVLEDWQAPATLPAGFPLVRVPDVLAALQSFAAWWRLRSDVQVIAITGSVGKTSTKEAIAGVLSTRFNTLKSAGNLNNEIGCPLTVLRLQPEHEKAVLEMGAGYQLGELTLLCDIARPEIAVVTLVGPVHLERMGTLENIALNKSELVRALPATGTAVLNGDDALVRAMSSVTSAHVLFYGLGPSCDIYATDIEGHGLEGVHFTLHVKASGQGWRVHLPLLGRHNVYTALAAAGAAHAAGMDWESIVAALEGLDAQVRLLVLPGFNGSTLIDDSYNAAPDSTVAALDLLSEMEGRKIAVLGDMRELGSHTERGHRRVGQRAAQMADALVLVGELGRIIGEEALASGMQAGSVFFAGGNEQASEYLRGILQPGDYVLVKGSRGLQMETIVDALKD